MHETSLYDRMRVALETILKTFEVEVDDAGSARWHQGKESTYLRLPSDDEIMALALPWTNDHWV